MIPVIDCMDLQEFLEGIKIRDAHHVRMDRYLTLMAAAPNLNFELKNYNFCVENWKFPKIMNFLDFKLTGRSPSTIWILNLKNWKLLGFIFRLDWVFIFCPIKCHLKIISSATTKKSIESFLYNLPFLCLQINLEYRFFLPKLLVCDSWSQWNNIPSH